MISAFVKKNALLGAVVLWADDSLAFGSTGHGFDSEHGLFSHHRHQPSAS